MYDFPNKYIKDSQEKKT